MPLPTVIKIQSLHAGASRTSQITGRIKFQTSKLPCNSGSVSIEDGVAVEPAAGSYPVELPKEREAADSEVTEGEVVDLLGRIVAGKLGGHGIEERHVARARKVPLPHLRRSAAESTSPPPPPRSCWLFGRSPRFSKPRWNRSRRGPTEPLPWSRL